MKDITMIMIGLVRMRQLGARILSNSVAKILIFIQIWVCCDFTLPGDQDD